MPSISELLDVLDLGLQEFHVVWDYQKELVARRARQEIPDTLLLTEHPPILTTGRRFQPENLLRADCPIPLQPVERGGDITYHGPGQMVGYPVTYLPEHRRNLRQFLQGLEDVLIAALGQIGIPATRRAGLTGVWAAEGKIASIGIAVRHWVTYHGFALNLNTDLSPFSFIYPCGIKGIRMTSVKELQGKEADMARMKQIISQGFRDRFGYDAAN